MTARIEERSFRGQGLFRALNAVEQYALAVFCLLFIPIAIATIDPSGYFHQPDFEHIARISAANEAAHGQPIDVEKLLAAESWILPLQAVGGAAYFLVGALLLGAHYAFQRTHYARLKRILVSCLLVGALIAAISIAVSDGVEPPREVDVTTGAAGLDYLARNPTMVVAIVLALMLLAVVLGLALQLLLGLVASLGRLFAPAPPAIGVLAAAPLWRQVGNLFVFVARFGPGAAKALAATAALLCLWAFLAKGFPIATASERHDALVEIWGGSTALVSIAIPNLMVFLALALRADTREAMTLAELRAPQRRLLSSAILVSGALAILITLVGTFVDFGLDAYAIDADIAVLSDAAGGSPEAAQRALAAFFLSGAGVWGTLRLVFAALLGIAIYRYFALELRDALRAALLRSRRNALEAVGVEDRRPCLFLRAFVDDERVIRSGAWDVFGRLAGLTSDRRRVEEALASELMRLGPLLALDNPRRPGEDLGAYRLDFERFLREEPGAAEYLEAMADQSAVGVETWRRQIQVWIDDAQLITVQLGDTPGLEWELGEIGRRHALEKTLFILPDVPHRRAGLFDLLVKAIPDAAVYKELPEFPQLLARATAFAIAPQSTTLRTIRSFGDDEYSFRALIAFAIDPKRGVVDLLANSGPREAGLLR